MIRYELGCAQGHAFESWFKSSAAYDRQAKQKLISCPICGSAKVDKQIMAPRLARAGQPAGAKGKPQDKTPVAMMSPQEQELRGKLRALRAHLTRNADYVGQRFPEEARRMHYGEIDHRSIYGEASPKEAKRLREEGIEFHPLPVLPDERN